MAAGVLPRRYGHVPGTAHVTGHQVGTNDPAREGTSPDGLASVALAVLASRPATGPTLAFFELLLGPANAALSGHLLFGVLDPTDELVASQRRDVLPGVKRRGIVDQCIAQVWRKFVHHSTGHSQATHGATVARSQRLLGRSRPLMNIWCRCQYLAPDGRSGDC
jgi:hypothetical protein